MNCHPNYQTAFPLAFSTDFSSSVFPQCSLKFLEPSGTPFLSSKKAAISLSYWHMSCVSTHTKLGVTVGKTNREERNHFLSAELQCLPYIEVWRQDEELAQGDMLG